MRAIYFYERWRKCGKKQFYPQGKRVIKKKEIKRFTIIDNNI